MDLYVQRNGRSVDRWTVEPGGVLRSLRTGVRLGKEAFDSFSKVYYSGPSYGVVASEESDDGDLPPPRFTSTSDIAQHLFEIAEEGGVYTIRNVPLFRTHPASESRPAADRAFIDRMIRNFYATKRAGIQLFGREGYWLPKWHYGHTPVSPDIPERNNAGFIDNLYRVGDFLFGDVTGLDKNAMDELVSGKWPDRSAEIDMKNGRLLSVAALGFRAPHFALPQMRGESLRKRYERLLNVEKHSLEDVYPNIVLSEEFPEWMRPEVIQMQHKITTQDLHKFFVHIHCNEDLREKFEADKNRKIEEWAQKHGGLMPQGPDLAGIIQAILQQMMMQQMNSGGYQLNAADLLDLEGRGKHALEPSSSDEGNLGGTNVDGGGEFGVDSEDGTPARSDDVKKDDDIIGADGEIHKNFRAASAILRDSIGNDAKVSGALKTIEETFQRIGEIVGKQQNALSRMAEESAREKRERRKEQYRNRLEELSRSGCAAVSNASLVEKHLNLLCRMDAETAEMHLAALSEAPTLNPVTRHSRLVTDSPRPGSKEALKARIQSDPEYRALMNSAGLTLNDIALAEIFSGLNGDGDGE